MALENPISFLLRKLQSNAGKKTTILDGTSAECDLVYAKHGQELPALDNSDMVHVATADCVFFTAKRISGQEESKTWLGLDPSEACLQSFVADRLATLDEKTHHFHLESLRFCFLPAA